MKNKIKEKMNNLSYTKKIINHFLNPRNMGEIKNPDGIGKVGNAKCGDIMWVYLKIKDNKIKDIKFKTMGCIAAIASSDTVCGLAKGKTLKQARRITKKDIAKKLGGLPPVKYHCSILGEEALMGAIKNYEDRFKNTKKNK